MPFTLIGQSASFHQFEQAAPLQGFLSRAEIEKIIVVERRIKKRERIAAEGR